MSVRSTVIMVLLCLGLGTFWYIHDYKGEAQRQEAKIQEERVFPGLKVEDIVGVRWTSHEGKSKEERVLKLDQGLWMLLAGEKFQCFASVKETRETIKQIAELSRTSVILEEPKDSDYATFSLDKPQSELELTVKNGDGAQDKKLVLLIGSETPAGDANYMRVKDQKPVLEVAAGFKEYFQERDIDVREKSALIVSPDKVAGLVIHQPGQGDIELSKSKEAKSPDSTDKEAAAKWVIVKPQSLRADLSAVNDYLWQLHSLEAVQFLPPLEKSRLGKLTASWDISVDGGRTISVELWGTSDSQGDKFFVRRPQTDEYMIAAFKDDKGERGKLADKTVSDFEDHRLAEYSIDDIRRIEIFLPSAAAGEKNKTAALEVRKIRDGWEVRRPEKCLRDEDKRNSAIFELAYGFTDMKWTEKHPGSAAKLKGNSAEAVVYGEKEQVLAHLHVGEKEAGSQGYGLTVEGQDTLYIVDKDPAGLWRDTLTAVSEAEKKNVPAEKKTAEESKNAASPAAVSSASSAAEEKQR